MLFISLFLQFVLKSCSLLIYFAILVFKRRVRGKKVDNVLSQTKYVQSTLSTKNDQLMDLMVHCPAHKENSCPNIAPNYQTPRPIPQSILQFPTIRKSTTLSSSGNVTSTVTKQHLSRTSSSSPGSELMLHVWLNTVPYVTVNYAIHILEFC